MLRPPDSPAYGEPIKDVYNRRALWYTEVCNYEFSNNAESGPDPKVRRPGGLSFLQTRHRSKPQLSTKPRSRQKSYFLSLAYPDIKSALPHIDEITTGADALELLCVDLLRDQDSFDKIGSYIPSKAYVASQLATLRLATSLPIVFTVRTVSQGGFFPDTRRRRRSSFSISLCVLESSTLTRRFLGPQSVSLA